jgi:hypothetical protein
MAGTAGVLRASGRPWISHYLPELFFPISGITASLAGWLVMKCQNRGTNRHARLSIQTVTESVLQVSILLMSSMLS